MKMNAIVVRSPSLLDELERTAVDFWGSWQPMVLSTGLTPRLDVHEEKDELVIRAELPGVAKDDLDIKIEGDTLRLEASKKQEEVPEDATYYACERCFGRYSRVLSLPFNVDAEKASASLEKGVLEIRLPKAEEAKSKSIKVQ
jgi:HSP20 family protein